MSENREKFPKGLVVALDNEKDNKAIVIESIKREQKYYIMATPFLGDVEGKNINNLTIDYTKCYVICYDENTGETTYNHNKDITKELVEKSLKGE